ncbi:MAG: glycosyltransferase family 2 protein [Prevotella sp.]|nr:glycosyltransferase family 2 protein [Prevotella sp.]
MENSALISVVTPVFNGNDFLKSIYKCLCDQTYANWEWVVVDDGSTDETWLTLTEIARGDERVRCFSQHNSGSAKAARDHAVYESRGDMLIQLDVDDRIEEHYMEKMLLRQQQTNADIVYPVMKFIDMLTADNTQSSSLQDRCTRTLPVEGFDASLVYNGRELVKETMPDWSIGCNGGLYRRKAWLNLSYPPQKEKPAVTSDEVDERLFLLAAERVAFSDAVYFYQNNDNSYTIRVTPKFFHYKTMTRLQLADVIEQNFAPDSIEVSRLHSCLFYGWRSMMACYAHNYGNLTGANDAIEAKLQQLFQRISFQRLTIRQRMHFLWLTDYKLLFILFTLKYNPRIIFEKLLQRYYPILYRLTIIRRRTEKEILKRIAPLYKDGNETAMKSREDAKSATAVVCIHTRGTADGGLVDRLRGAVSVFQQCLRTGRDFRLFFDYPFPLTDYLVPAEYDWQIDRNDIIWNTEKAHVVICDTQTTSQIERRQHRKLFYKEFTANSDKQIHCYTNSPISFIDGFADSFRKLFRPSDRLSQHLKEISDDIAAPYITVSARFCNLLGDFNEEVYNEPLPAAEQQQLLYSSIEQLVALKQQHADKRIVVCSDSTTFLERSREAIGAYIIDGTVSHIGNDTIRSYEYYEKTFLDFFTIARADAVFLLKGPGMYRSNFPQAAALLGGKTCEVVVF